MADEMDRASQAAGKQLDSRMNILRERLQRLATARIAEIQRRVASAFDRPLHPLERSRRPADSMQRHDAVLRHLAASPLTYTRAPATTGNSRACRWKPCS